MTLARALLLGSLLCPAAAPAAETLAGGDYPVEVVRDVAYHDGPDADPAKHKLDLFLPRGKAGFPVLFFIHGGAWSSGDRKMYGGVGRVFARNGIGTVVISYRLSPGVQHPAHVEDVARAFAWTHRNIAARGGRVDQIFVTGQSAGGHLAALLATDPKYLAAHGLSPRDIKGVMPISGVYRFRDGFMPRVIGRGPEAVESVSPLAHVSGDEPPFLILYADDDFPGCGRMSDELRRALADRKVEAELLEIRGRTHISIIVRLMLSEADPASQALLAFVARHAGMPLAPRVAGGGGEAAAAP